ncbi:MAG: DUF790 family protein [Deltaproteobacteria bacterium]|nr:DUF790 family protein [Deltaproteobacteria bacterium]
MLTSELLRVRRQGKLVVPRFLSASERARLGPVAWELVATLAGAAGHSRDDVTAALSIVDHLPKDRPIVRGLEKLLLDRCEFLAPEGDDPETLRDAVFRLAAEARRALGPTERFDRARVLSLAAERLDLDAERIEARLFADLRKNERLTHFRPTTVERLLERYDVALVQGVLLRALRVVVTLEGESPDRVRQLFRTARFHGLLHRVTRDGTAHRIELDGPLSLFTASQRYGLALALFVPAVLRCRRFRLEADVLWGKERRPMRLELGPEAGLVPHGRALDGMAPELERFIAGFGALESSWDVTPCDDIVAIPGEAAVVPDLVFTNRETGERVWLEVFGYWSRAAVWQRIETVRRGFPGRILLAVGKQLRVSEDLLDESEAGELYVYRTSPQPKALLERLERDGAS